MKHHSGKLVSLLSIAILLCATAIGQNGGLRFRVTDLGTFGGTWSEAFALNDSGTVVGTFGVPGGQRCFIWQNGALTKFDGGATPPKCEALAVDSLGNIAGSMAIRASGSVYRAFRYDNGGKLVSLPVPPGYDYSMGFGIQGGTVVGGIGDSSSWAYCDHCSVLDAGLQVAVKWDAAGSLTTLVTGQLSNDGNFARAINKKGEIVGRVYNNGQSDFPRAFLWKNGVYTELPTATAIDVRPYADAYAINDNGSIVGGGNLDDGIHRGAYGCVQQWNSRTPGNLPTNYPNCPPGAENIAGMAISSDNWVVGHNDFFQEYPPFLIVPDPNCALTGLNTLLNGSGLGWYMIHANGINRLHQIVGSAFAPDGALHAVLLTPNNSPLC